ncbi:type II toxin-antitoxin system HicB family antitoxin [Methanoplanus endosymbiosus]|uniref:Type II toxin-antitoxin system HicB family antitoxin n=1 Tax=Methanoplanus endosymbiosus TaxID=33865 RepID=A0A9E7PM06_9EURY|nr:type II toxin-antitoxin system HicB family antitoxin [Methanoplanus endosymbiosus]UUX91802.1 type II toxin-antitoxin system HicB family antitoxin [Methanoplanus endosymbiosus]
MKFNIIIEIDEEGGYIAECPDLPGCITEGDTQDEAIRNLNEAIIGCLKSRLKSAINNIKFIESDEKLNISLDISENTGSSYA